MRRCQICLHSISKIAMSLPWKMTDQVYDYVLIQLVGSDEFGIKDDRSSVWLKMKAIGAMFLMD